MSINELIACLEQHALIHGGTTEVKVSEYAGGEYELYDVRPVFNSESNAIIINGG